MRTTNMNVDQATRMISEIVSCYSCEVLTKDEARRLIFHILHVTNIIDWTNRTEAFKEGKGEIK